MNLSYDLLELRNRRQFLVARNVEFGLRAVPLHPHRLQLAGRFHVFQRLVDSGQQFRLALLDAQRGGFPVKAFREEAVLAATFIDKANAGRLRQSQALDLALLRWMVRHMPHARLLLLGRRSAPAELPAALCAGAHGYFCMRDSHEQLLATAGLVLQGLLCFPADTHRALGQWQPPPQALAATALRQPSPAHREFLRWVAHPAGLAYADIARRMGRSERAVEKYRAVLFKRHGIKSRMGLVYLARQLGLEG